MSDLRNGNGRTHVVIVGGGSAGAVLASRLSEDPTRSVLLLEAGTAYGVAGYPDDLRDAVHVPGNPENDAKQRMVQAGANGINWIGVVTEWTPDYTSAERAAVIPGLLARGGSVGLFRRAPTRQRAVPGGQRLIRCAAVRALLPSHEGRRLRRVSSRYRKGRAPTVHSGSEVALARLGVENDPRESRRRISVRRPR